MIQTVKLSQRLFRAATIPMFHEVKVNTNEITENTQGLSRGEKTSLKRIKWKLQRETQTFKNEGRATNGKYLDKYKKRFPIFFYFSSKAKIITLSGEGFDVFKCNAYDNYNKGWGLKDPYGDRASTFYMRNLQFLF